MVWRSVSRKEIHQFANWWIFHTALRERYFPRGKAPEQMDLKCAYIDDG